MSVAPGGNSIKQHRESKRNPKGGRIPTFPPHRSHTGVHCTFSRDIIPSGPVSSCDLGVCKKVITPINVIFQAIEVLFALQLRFLILKSRTAKEFKKDPVNDNGHLHPAEERRTALKNLSYVFHVLLAIFPFRKQLIKTVGTSI